MATPAKNALIHFYLLILNFFFSTQLLLGRKGQAEQDTPLMIVRLLKNVGLHVLLLPFVPVNMAILFCLWMLRQITGICLKLGFQKKWQGLLNSADKIYTPTKLVVILTYLRSERKFNLMEAIRLKLVEKVFNDPKSYPKLRATYHTSFGQDYLLKDQVDLEEVLTALPLPVDNATTFDEKYLNSYINILGKSPLPKNDTALWQIHVPLKPLECPQFNVEGFLYPVIFRFHHCVGDGRALTDFIAQLLDAKFDTNYRDKWVENHTRKNTIAKVLMQWLKLAISLLQVLLIGPGTFLTISRQANNSPFNGRRISGEKLVVWAMENDTTRHVNTVKKIKNIVPNTKFSDVLFTCISGAFYTVLKHAMLNEKPVELNCWVPLFYGLMEANTTKPVKLTNCFTFGCLKLPLIDPETDPLERLEKVKSSMNKLNDGYEKEMFHWLTNYISAVVPASIRKYLMSILAYNVVISSLPGTAKMRVLDDCEILNCLVIGPVDNQSGLNLTIYTYDDKFHIVLNVDKAFISDPKEAQSILDEVLKNMEQMHEQIIKSNYHFKVNIRDD